MPASKWPIVWALACIHAALFALAFPPFDVWFLAFIALLPLALMAICAASTRMALLAAFATQAVMWLWLFRWILPVTGLGYPFLALYMSIWPAAFVWVTRRISLHPVTSRWPVTLVLPVLWVGVEFFRGDVLFYGYPWYLLGHPLVAKPLLVQSADLFGAYFTSFLIAVFAGFAVGVILQAQRCAGSPDDATRRASARRFVTFGGLVVALWLGNLIYGSWRMHQTAPLTRGPGILAIQTNLPQDNKVGWSPEQQTIDVPAFIELTRRAYRESNPKPDLIVWPETMVPSLGFESQTIQDLQLFGTKFEHLWKWTVAIESLSRELQTPMLVGTEAWIDTSIVTDPTNPNLRKLDRKRTYNSAYLIQGSPPYQRYDKYFLTPFGETMPYISGWPWLERLFLTLGVGADLSFNLDSNPDIRLLELQTSSAGGDAKVRLATPICFEDTVARFCRRMAYDSGVKRVDVLVNISNDGWFGKSDADRTLHAQIARFRCIENRVPMVRSVNTGVSVAIDSSGRLTAGLGTGRYGEARQAGWVLAPVQLDSRITLYGRIGELWPWCCLIVTVALVVFTVFCKRKAGVT